MHDNPGPLVQNATTYLAIAGSALAVGLVAALAALRSTRQRLRAESRERTALTSAYTQLAFARSEAQAQASGLATLLAGMPDGVVMFDKDLRLVQWNRRFAEIAGVPPGVLVAGCLLEDMIRAQALAGEFGRGDVEAEVSRRTAAARRAGELSISERQRPNGRVIELRRRSLPEGGLITMVSDVTSRRRIGQPLRSEPVALQPAQPPGLPERVWAVPARPPRRARVLLVEDILVNQLVTATQLRRDGHNVDVASTGAEAVRMVTTTPYDVVLMDLMMPGMSGFEATRTIRHLPGLPGQIPILALTANDRPQDRALCTEAGMQGMLSKPVSAESLAQAIANQILPRREPPSPAHARADRLLDTDRLDELRDGLPPGLFVSLAEQCIVDMRERMMDLDDAVETGEMERTLAAAHALAGMAGSYGMAAVERRMRQLMAAAQSLDAQGCRHLIRGMDQELHRTEEALQMLVQPASP